MKRREFVRHLAREGCRLKRHGAKHDVYLNPLNGKQQTLSRQVEIPNLLAKKICRRLGVKEASA